MFNYVLISGGYLIIGYVVTVCLLIYTDDNINKKLIT